MRRILARIDAFRAGSARAVQPLEVRPFDEKVERENRCLEEAGGNEPRKRAENQCQPVGLQIPNGVHRTRDETVGTGRDGPDCGVGIEEVVPVVGVNPQRARGPELRAEADDDET